MMFPPPEDVAVVMGQPKTWDIADRRVEKVDNPSLHSPSLAPTGKYALTIYTVAPDTLAKGTWSDCGEELAEKLVSEAERHIPGLRQHTITRLILTPEDYRKRTHQNHHSFGGVPSCDGETNHRPTKPPSKVCASLAPRVRALAGVSKVMVGAQKVAKRILGSE